MGDWGVYGDRHVKDCPKCQAAMLFCALEPTARKADPPKTCRHAKECLGAVIKDYVPRDNPRARYDIQPFILDRLYRDFYKMTPQKILVRGYDLQTTLGSAKKNGTREAWRRLRKEHEKRDSSPDAFSRVADQEAINPSDVGDANILLEQSLRALKESIQELSQTCSGALLGQLRILEVWLEYRAVYIWDSLRNIESDAVTQRGVARQSGINQTAISRALSQWTGQVLDKVADRGGSELYAWAKFLLSAEPIRRDKHKKKGK